MTAALPSPFLKTLGFRVLACFLVLWTPFFVFVAYRGYPIPPLSLLYSAGFCVLLSLLLGAICGRGGDIRQTIVFACLVALFLDIQFDWFSDAIAYLVFALMLALFWVLRRHLAMILSAVFAVLLVSTAVLGPTETYREVATTEREAAPGAGAGPAGIVHLLLDEHAGILGIPEDLPGGEALRQDLRAFFVSNGFRLFGGAVSEYQSSKSSISGMLNFTAGPHPYERYQGKRPYVLTKNAYFEALSEAGYRIEVHQSTYMDFCREQAELISRCDTYRYDGTDWLKDSALSDFGKLSFLFGMYLQLSDYAESALKLYARRGPDLRGLGIDLPPLLEWDDSPSSLNAMAAFDRMVDQLAAGTAGKLYFAHLLLPHGPYAFDAQCRLRSEFSSWASNRPPYRKANSEDERSLRYQLYFDQVRCMQRRLQALFDRLRSAGLYADTTIVIHGDHGARINLVVPRAQNRESLSTQDYLDNFSTLFAAKSPAFQAGYEDELVPASRLLAEAIGRPDLVPSPVSELVLYLEGDKDEEPWTAVPWRFPE